VSLDIGIRIRDLRESQRLSLTTLAQRAGIARSSLYGIEQGKTSPTLRMIQKIAFGLGQPVSSFLNVHDPSEHVVSPMEMMDTVAARCPICNIMIDPTDVFDGIVAGSYIEHVGFIHRCGARGGPA
jgi:transcriptional regulator with XRE-family HTH domain